MQEKGKYLKSFSIKLNVLNEKQIKEKKQEDERDVLLKFGVRRHLRPYFHR